MPRPHTFTVETVLYHPTEGKRVFPVGETDPGAMWSEKPGGEPVGAKASLQALHDLIEAQERIEALEAQLVRNGADLDNLAKGKADALAQVHELEQRAIAAEKARADAEDLAGQYMRERDAARQQLAAAQKPAPTKAA